MKGIIVDLDNTLWKGVISEDGIEGVQFGGIYKQFRELLAKMVDEGVLIAVASKNEPLLVLDALRNPAFLSLQGKMFPIEASWDSKSEAIERILKVWNILSEDVVFIDDSEFELGEVRAQFPDIHLIHFVPEQLGWIVGDFARMFGYHKPTLVDELRLESIKQGVLFAREAAKTDPEEFYSGLKAKLTVKNYRDDKDRAVELINKSNQFNLNGVRTNSDNPVLGVTFQYEDKYGKLGTIAVVAGDASDTEAKLNYFCLSCRAFNRRIEYAILDFLFGFDDTILLKLIETEKNGPFQKFIYDLWDYPVWEGDYIVLTKEQFQRNRPKLYFPEIEISNE